MQKLYDVIVIGAGVVGSALARYVISMMMEREEFAEDSTFAPYRKPITRFEQLCPEEQARLIGENPDYGELICRCEKVTRAEVLQAIHNPLGCATMVSVKYRTRSMMGRCQGGYCQMRISRMLEEETGQKETDLVYMRKNGHPFFGKVRDINDCDLEVGVGITDNRGDVGVVK